MLTFGWRAPHLEAMTTLVLVFADSASMLSQMFKERNNGQQQSCKAYVIRWLHY